MNAARIFFFKVTYIFLWLVLAAWLVVNVMQQFRLWEKEPTPEEIYTYNQLVKNKDCAYEKIPDEVKEGAM